MNVADNGFDIYDGLSGYFDDVVDYEGEKARMEVTLVDLPPLLQIQLQVSPAQIAQQYILNKSIAGAIQQRDFPTI